MINIVHFADYHLGVDTHGPVDAQTRLNGRVLDYLDSLDALIEYAVDNGADIAVFAGDAYHKHNPDPTYQREFGERIVKLAEHCPVVLLVGNHDMPGSIDKASAVDIFSTLRVPNVHVGWDFNTEVIETAHGAIQVTTFPYPLRQQFLSAAELKGSPEIVLRLFKERLSLKLRELASGLDEHLPAIIVGHFSVDSAVYGSERAMTIGYDAEVALEDLLYWDYAALGHIHYHQCLTTELDGAPPVVYAGSLDRVDFGEEKDDKGFVWVELGDEAKWEFVLIDARPFVTIHVDVTEYSQPTSRIVDKILKYHERGLLKGAVVRLKIDLKERQAAQIRQSDIYKTLGDCGVYFVHTISLDIQRQRRARLEIAGDDVPLSSVPHTELLQLYFEHEGKSSKEVKDLMRIVREIMTEEE